MQSRLSVFSSTSSKKIHIVTPDSPRSSFSNIHNISSPDFKRRSIYISDPGYRKISAFAADPENSKNITAATKHSIYRSADGGITWKSIPISVINKRNYIMN